MEFINDEAEVSDETYSEKSDQSDNETQLDNDFIDDNVENNESTTFYRSFDNDKPYEPQFHNKTKTYEEAMAEESEPYYGEDGQPEMYDPEVIENVDFHYFSDYKKKAASFKETLLCFPIEAESNLLFSAVIYGIYYLQKNEKPTDFLSAIEKIGQDKILKLEQIKKEIMLDYTLFGFFECCMRLNKVLAKEFGYFLRFYERRNKFRYQLKQKLKSKNEFKSELSACVIQKFNGYDLLRADLDEEEKIYISPIDIVYEPTQDIYEPIYC